MGYDDLTTQTLTGTNDYSATVQGPVDGYRAFVATVNTGLQTLINNDSYLKEQTDLIPGVLSTLSQMESYDARFNTTMRQAINIYSGMYTQQTEDEMWVVTDNGMINNAACITDIGKLYIYVPTYEAQGAYIQSVTFRVKGPSQLPNNMPNIKMYKTTITSTAKELCDNYIGGVDTSATAGAFDDVHDIYLSWASGDRPAVGIAQGEMFEIIFSPGWGATHTYGLAILHAHVFYNRDA